MSHIERLPIGSNRIQPGTQGCISAHHHASHASFEKTLEWIQLVRGTQILAANKKSLGVGLGRNSLSHNKIKLLWEIVRNMKPSWNMKSLLWRCQVTNVNMCPGVLLIQIFRWLQTNTLKKFYMSVATEISFYCMAC